MSAKKILDKNGAAVVKYSYIFGAAGERLKVVETGITYEYDLNGNLVKKTNDGSRLQGEQTTTYTYNAQNRLIRVTVQSGQQMNVEEYRYDYAGKRIAKIGQLVAFPWHCE